jgi:hypothetical protein
MANNAGMAISADFSELAGIERLLENARTKLPKVRSAALKHAADRTQAEAEQIAASYPDPLDELAHNIQQEGTDLTRRIWTDKRQGHFLHFGSPNTGAPRDWLHGPTGRAADQLFEELSQAAVPE